MAGLSIVLESQKHTNLSQVINKTTIGVMTNKQPPPLPSSQPPVCSSSSRSSVSSSLGVGSLSLPGFLKQCFLCGVELLPGKDIYMYRGDRAFCSAECRAKQIHMDEEEIHGKSNNAGGGRSTASSKAPPGPPRGNKRHGSRNSMAGFVY